MDKIVELLKGYYEYVFIGVGVIWIVGAILDFGSINKYSTADSGKFYKRFIYHRWGETGYKVMNIFMGIVFILAGILFLFGNGMLNT